MSIVRFSHINDYELWAPRSDGQLDPKKKVGSLLQTVQPGEQGEPPKRLVRHLENKVLAVPADAPLVIMIHGFDFNPFDNVLPHKSSNNPHAVLFHFGSEDLKNRIVSWPIRFGFRKADRGESGLAIAFGWDSNTKPYHLKAYHRGTDACWSLIAILAAIHSVRANRRVHLVAHSLGTHVVIRLLRILCENEHVRYLLPTLHRVVLMGGAEFVLHARRTYALLEQTSDKKGISLRRHLEVYNLMSRADRVVSIVSGIVTYGPLGTEKHMIGYYGLQRGKRPKNWIDIVLSDSEVRRWFERTKGFELHVRGDAPNDFLDHWDFYVHKGNTELIRRILREETGTTIPSMRAKGLPEIARQLKKEKTSWASDKP